MKGYVNLFELNQYSIRPMPLPAFWKAGLGEHYIRAAFGAYLAGEHADCVPLSKDPLMIRAGAADWSRIMVQTNGEQCTVAWRMQAPGVAVCLDAGAPQAVHDVFAWLNRSFASGFIPHGKHDAGIRYASPDPAVGPPCAFVVGGDKYGYGRAFAGPACWPLVPKWRKPDVMYSIEAGTVWTAFDEFARRDLLGAGLFVKDAEYFRRAVDRVFMARLTGQGV
jgi:hypothetical protein